MKVIVIGETCVDEFIYGDVKRLSPEAPVPVFTPIETTSNDGMAGNTIANIKALSPESYISSLTQEGSITKTRYVDKKSNHMFIRIDKGEDNIKQLSWNPMIDIMIGSADIVIVSDYDKGFLTNSHLQAIGKKSKLSILDSKRKMDNSFAQYFTFIKLNESEAKSNPQFTHPGLITTLGAKGAKIREHMFNSPKPQETIDVSGAGDTFTAAFILKYYQTKNEFKSIEFANKCAANVVNKRGVSVPDLVA